MNYTELSDKLTDLGERLGKQAHKLYGESLGKSARRLAATLEEFEQQLDGYLAGRKSGELRLELWLRSPSSKKLVNLY